MSGNHPVRARAGRQVRVALTLIGLVMVALVPMAPANAATTIKVSRSTVIGGESIIVSGTLGQRKARPVVLQRKSGTIWVKVLAKKSTTTGAFRFTYKPPTKAGSRTVLRVIAPRVRISGRTYSQITTGSRTVLTAAQSATVTAPSVVAKDALFTVTGRFTPARAGRSVGLQRLDNGIWVGALPTKPQNASGIASFSLSLPEQGTFQFRVVTLASGGAPQMASAAAFVSVAMPTPTGLSATPGDASVQLSWNAVSANGLVGYAVYKRTDPGDLAAGWTKVTQVSGTSYTVTGLDNGVTHYFSVTSVNGSGGQSAFAPKVSATPVAPPDTTPPPVPTGVDADPGNTTAQVSWSAVATGDLAGYNVYQGPSASGPWTKVNGSLISAPTTTYQATSLVNGTQYFFAVTSVDNSPAANESARSTPAAATPAVGADTTPPPVPSGVVATPGNTSAQVTWNAVVAGDLAGYNVYQGPSASGPWTKLNGSLISAPTTTYQASSLVNGTQYFFAVTSADTNTPVANESVQSTAAPATPVAPPAGWSAVSAGLQHTCALGTDSTLWCWGYNSDGQLGSNADVTSPTPTKVGSASTWTSVSAGGDSTCGVQSNGTLWCWGSNKYGQLGNNTNSGTSTANPAPLQVPGTTWASVSVGTKYACARQTNGTVWCWGFNSDGQLGRTVGADPLAANPTPGQVGSGTAWASVSAGTDHTCATQTGGTLWCWGSNIFGQLGNGANLDGTPTPTPTQVGVLTTWTTVSTGEYHTCALQTGGAAFCWGSNAYGELGKAANADPNHPPSAAGTGWTSISAGGDHTCGTKSDGVYCFGRNQYAQLGKAANAIPNPTAAKVAASTSAWTSVNSGGASTCARTTANKVFCWGLNEFGQLGNPSTVGTTPNPTPFDVLVPAG